MSFVVGSRVSWKEVEEMGEGPAGGRMSENGGGGGMGIEINCSLQIRRVSQFEEASLLGEFHGKDGDEQEKTLIFRVDDSCSGFTCLVWAELRRES